MWSILGKPKTGHGEVRTKTLTSISTECGSKVFENNDNDHSFHSSSPTLLPESESSGPPSSSDDDSSIRDGGLTEEKTTKRGSLPPNKPPHQTLSNPASTDQPAGMTDHTHRPHSGTRTPISFALCTHTAPPTPRPAVSPSTAIASPSFFPFRCFHCDYAYRRSTQTLILDTFDDLIRDQRARLLIAYERAGTARETLFDGEMVAEGQRRVRVWEAKRKRELERAWEGFVGRWNGALYLAGSQEKKLNIKLVLEEGDRGDGGMRVDGLSTDITL